MNKKELLKIIKEKEEKLILLQGERAVEEESVMQFEEGLDEDNLELDCFDGEQELSEWNLIEIDDEIFDLKNEIEELKEKLLILN